MKRYRTRFGSDVLVEESRAVPVVDLSIVWDVGAIDDPVLGSARMLARLLRRGSRGMDPTAIDEEAALLGGRLGISISRTMIRIQGSVLARNLAPFVALLAKMLREPALRAASRSSHTSARLIVAHLRDRTRLSSTCAKPSSRLMSRSRPCCAIT